MMGGCVSRPHISYVSRVSTLLRVTCSGPGPKGHAESVRDDFISLMGLKRSTRCVSGRTTLAVTGRSTPETPERHREEPPRLAREFATTGRRRRPERHRRADASLTPTWSAARHSPPSQRPRRQTRRPSLSRAAPGPRRTRVPLRPRRGALSQPTRRVPTMGPLPISPRPALPRLRLSPTLQTLLPFFPTATPTLLLLNPTRTLKN